MARGFCVGAARADGTGRSLSEDVSLPETSRWHVRSRCPSSRSSEARHTPASACNSSSPRGCSAC
eukprot:6426616-Prymnesium_polylepis.1